MSPATVALILKAMDLVAMGVTMVPEMKARYDEVTAKLKEMANEGRDPTDAEWKELNDKLDSALGSLKDRADEAKS